MPTTEVGTDVVAICAYCRRVRDEQQLWQRQASHLALDEPHRYTHGICPDCYASVVLPELNALEAARGDSGEGLLRVDRPKETEVVTSAERELLGLNARLLDSISQGDWSTYRELCDPSLTAFEPESLGLLVEGMAFHEFYFGLPRTDLRSNTTLSTPHVRLLGDIGIVSYVRLTQRAAGDGPAATTAANETWIWQRQNGDWRMVHFHRSAVG